ncbi:hypothetical protein BDFB_000605 [Asbolus verrucosus]|uniref:Protein stoned-A n=1 Tax=Asbolus verrucosus TaxID=1661398 RepID=A0A482W814_ASBVE|nr:hypothetical protein BDFB_000605 [Asbolus verrucosus]
MHKITKGLKKKKKGKKSKHKEEELFKPEELEAYRREHQEDSSGAAPGQNEEWKKFLALTSGVDDILKKTQGDLDRIKSTSFFQRVPPPSEVKKQEQAAQENSVNKEPDKITREEVEKTPDNADIGIVQVSESESDEEEDDDIFDTTYIDAIAAGEVKLAYIPESPTEEASGDDPFDTTIAERAILGPAVERKGKKLVPIGAAVEVLTGRVQIPTCATARPASTRRQILQEQNLLLGSFDDNANSIPTAVQANSSEEPQRTLLDDDTPIPLADEPINLNKSLHQIPPVPTPTGKAVSDPKGNNIVNEFDVIGKDIIADEDDEDFAILAAESLAKTPVTVNSAPLNAAVAAPKEENWAAFVEEKPLPSAENGETADLDEDPFDTTFAENILPGKAELKIIENEILREENDIDFNPRAEDKLSQIINKVSIKITDPAGQRESVSSLDRVSAEADLNLIKPIHRDLLGGSNTDLSNLSDQPLRPSEQIDDNYIEYCDPFDTSIVETVKLPGHTELKFLEKELLGDINQKKSSLSDEEFDPRADEPKERTLSRPDVLNITTKTVSFDLPSPQNNLLEVGEENTSKVSKPLTPFYVRKNSVPEQFIPEDDNSSSDPFDTSFVNDIGPGKLELKLIESELFDPATERSLNISDQDFDPRDENKVKIEQVVQSIKDIVNVKSKLVEEVKQIDLLAVDHQVSVKVLTPAAEKPQDFDEISYTDPFDTSIATNILPGKTELKLLETELIHSTNQNLVDANFDPRAFDAKRDSFDLLDNTSDAVSHQPLNPEKNSFDTNEDIDPFDTSIANNIVPGKTELKLLESELM